MKKVITAILLLLVAFATPALSMTDAEKAWLQGEELPAVTNTAAAVVEYSGIRFGLPAQYVPVVDDFLIECFGTQAVQKIKTDRRYDGDILYAFAIDAKGQSAMELQQRVSQVLAKYQETGGRVVKSPSNVQQGGKFNPLGLLVGVAKLAVPALAWHGGWTDALGNWSNAIGVVDGIRAVGSNISPDWHDPFAPAY
jgi:hypothetical protein